MAGIKAPMLDIMNRLQSLTWADTGLPVFQHVRVWNNQVEYEREGQMYNWPKPAAFLEVVNDPIYEQLGMGIQTTDVAFRIHIVHEQYDAGNNTFEQNLEVFDIRDRVCSPAGLSLFQPTGTGPLTRALETQDYEHDNIYHYLIDFVAAFIDSTGSPLDPNNGQIITKDPPTDVDIQAQLVPGIEGVENNVIFKSNYKFRIPGGSNC